MIFRLEGSSVAEAPPVWSEELRVRSHEVDANGRTSVLAVCNWLQEAAGNHATALAWAVDQLQAQGLTWVLSRLHLRLSRIPAWREPVTVTTWPAGSQRVYAVREFRISGKDGDEIGVATSGWLLVRLASRRPVRLPATISAMRAHTPARVLDDPFEKLPELERAEHERSFAVRYSNLDMNRHANNVSVIAWALDAVPEEVLLGSVLTEFEVDFRAEARFGDRITAQVCAQEPPAETFLHRLVHEGGREIARARSRWRR
jgi:medium-chain acyl-[acyl-carrier-protein] hydrolase